MTAKTTNFKDFIALYDKLKATKKEHEYPTLNNHFKPRGCNYFLIGEDVFFLIGKKEYEFWNRKTI